MGFTWERSFGKDNELFWGSEATILEECDLGGGWWGVRWADDKQSAQWTLAIEWRDQVENTDIRVRYVQSLPRPLSQIDEHLRFLLSVWGCDECCTEGTRPTQGKAWMYIDRATWDVRYSVGQACEACAEEEIRVDRGVVLTRPIPLWEVK